MSKNIPEKVSNRLTLYHSILVEYIEEGIESISSPQIAQRLDIDDSQVRKDFKLLNNAGKCRVGYIVKDLKDSIEKTLGFANTKDAFIVGAGHLGLALAKYDSFNSYGLNILALFDNDPQKVDMQVNNKQIFHISKLPNLVERLGVEIAILTVPRQYAQQVAEFLIESNIKYIWNFTPAVLKVPPTVKVWNENIMGSFLQFACKDII
ncbi:MAG: redox-sensing transcriptional repressor Rex [Clostridium sp.]|nr:redox-sensing transcriptional repressor Rex [Clostridium sp.]